MIAGPEAAAYTVSQQEAEGVTLWKVKAYPQ